MAEIVAGGKEKLKERPVISILEAPISPLLKPKTRAKWVEDGSKSLVELAREKARAILAEHQPAPMDEATLESLKELVKTAQKDFEK